MRWKGRPPSRAAFLADSLGDDPELLREPESMLRHASDATWVERAVNELSLLSSTPQPE